jgi:hypothetical protein
MFYNYLQSIIVKKVQGFYTLTIKILAFFLFQKNKRIAAQKHNFFLNLFALKYLYTSTPQKLKNQCTSELFSRS